MLVNFDLGSPLVWTRCPANDRDGARKKRKRSSMPGKLYAKNISEGMIRLTDDQRACFAIDRSWEYVGKKKKNSDKHNYRKLKEVDLQKCVWDKTKFYLFNSRTKVVSDFPCEKRKLNPLSVASIISSAFDPISSFGVTAKELKEHYWLRCVTPKRCDG